MTTPATNPVKSKTCLFPKCKKTYKCRGLCPGHYSTALKLIRMQKVTWEQLEKAGKCLGQNRDRTGISKAWFLEAKTPKQ